LNLNAFQMATPNQAGFCPAVGSVRGLAMPPLPDHRHEIVARALARGKTQYEASKIAGYPEGSSFAPNSRRRAQLPDIRARKLELEREMVWETDPGDPQNFELIATRLLQLANELPAAAHDRALAVRISDDLWSLLDTLEKRPWRHVHEAVAQ
jgi:hypothetical protein